MRAGLITAMTVAAWVLSQTVTLIRTLLRIGREDDGTRDD
jgi:hypothetical protein